jgi:hypothetical protein
LLERSIPLSQYSSGADLSNADQNVGLQYLPIIQAKPGLLLCTALPHYTADTHILDKRLSLVRLSAPRSKAPFTDTLRIYGDPLPNSSLAALTGTMAGTSSSSVELISREKEQAGEEKEHYCSECREKILPWKRDLYEERTNLGASFGNNEYKQNLHKDLLEFLECAKWCRFCSYLCSLFNEQWLRNQIHGFTSGDNAFVEIGFDSYQSRCDSFGTFEVVQMRVILQFVPLTDFHLPLENRVFEPKIEERRFNVCTAAGEYY